MFLKRITKIFSKRVSIDSDKPCANHNTDEAELKIGDLEISFVRSFAIPAPYEFSVFVPRVELRQRYYKDNKLMYEKEQIYNSITIVSAPRHPPLDEGAAEKPGRSAP